MYIPTTELNQFATEGSCIIYVGDSDVNCLPAGTEIPPEMENIKDAAIKVYLWQSHSMGIPEGYLLQNTCGNEDCCNVEHLEVVTPEEAANNNSFKDDQLWDR